MEDEREREMYVLIPGKALLICGSQKKLSQNKKNSEPLWSLNSISEQKNNLQSQQYLSLTA